MQLRTALVVLVVVLIAAFCALNWSVLVSPTALSLGVASVQAPLGLMMLGLTVLLAAAFLVYIVLLQAAMMTETRRLSRDLQAQRQLADNAEASRFDQLRAASQAQTEELRMRIDQLDRELRSAFDAAANGINATLGEIDDRIQRGTGADATGR